MQWPLHPVVNYEYFSLSPSILGISQAWLLLSLTVAHNEDMKLKIFWSTEQTTEPLLVFWQHVRKEPATFILLSTIGIDAPVIEV
jgi:hypothetical protein